jgi:tetratricopeptide (TPR) repeat protein
MARRDQLSREAYSLARNADDADALREALGARLWACLGPDSIDERLAVARRILELAERLGDRRFTLLGLEGLYGASLLRGELDAADRVLISFRRVAEELRQPVFLFQATLCEGSRALSRGEFDAAERLFRQALEIGRATVPFAHFSFTGQMISLHFARGDPDDPELSRVFFGEMMELPYSWEPAVRSALANYLFVQGDPDGARRILHELAVDDFRDLPRDEHWLVTMASLGNVCTLLGDAPRAALLLELLSAYGDLIVVHDLLRTLNSTVWATLGHLATALERYEDAEEHYRKAIRREAALGLAPALLISRSGYATMLLRRNRPGDRRRAEALIGEIREHMKDLGVRGQPLYLRIVEEEARRRGAG